MDDEFRRLERALLAAPEDWELRQRVSCARVRAHGFDWQMPVMATASDEVATNSETPVIVPGLDRFYEEIAKRPPQTWLVQAAACVSMRVAASGRVERLYDTLPLMGAEDAEDDPHAPPASDPVEHVPLASLSGPPADAPVGSMYFDQAASQLMVRVPSEALVFLRLETDEPPVDLAPGEFRQIEPGGSIVTTFDPSHSDQPWRVMNVCSMLTTVGDTRFSLRWRVGRSLHTGVIRQRQITAMPLNPVAPTM